MKSRWLLLIPPILLFLSLSNSVFASLCLFFLTSFFSVCIRSVQSLSHVRLFVIPWTAACQDSLSFTISHSLLKFMPIKLMMLYNQLILCQPRLLLPLIFPRIRVFSNKLALLLRCPKYWSFSFSNSSSNEYSGLISFRIGWFDLLAVQGTLKSLLQNHSSKASVIWFSVFFMVQLSYPSLSTWLLEKLAIITLHLMVLMDNWAVVFL